MSFTVDYDKGILEEAGITAHIYATFISHSHGVPGVYDHRVKNVPGVHMLYSADLAL